MVRPTDSPPTPSRHLPPMGFATARSDRKIALRPHLYELCFGFASVCFRCCLLRMDVEFGVREAHHPFVEPVDNVFEAFDAVPRLS